MIEIKDINESYTHIDIGGDLEFGKRIIDTLSVHEEGYQFSPLFRSGLWDGKKHFYKILENRIFKIPKGLVKYIEADLQKREIPYNYITSETQETQKITKEELSDFIKTLNIPFSPYDYQEKAVFDMINDKRTVIKSATGSGKSLMIYIFMRWMLSQNKRCILVVPSIGLVTQMAQDFEDYGWSETKDYLKQIGGKFKDKLGKKNLHEKPLVLSTWQSLMSFRNKKKVLYDTVEHKIGTEIDKVYTVLKKRRAQKGELKKLTLSDGTIEIVKTGENTGNTGNTENTPEIIKEEIISECNKSDKYWVYECNENQFNLFDGIIIDEAHKIKGDVLNEITLNATKASIRIGLTGSIPRIRVDKLQLLGTLGKVNNVM